MMRVYVEGVGLCGPGLDGWAESLPVLVGLQHYVPEPIRMPPVALLPANERRRAVQTVKLALAVGTEAFAMSGRDPGQTATVFASSGGDGETIHEILNVLASASRELSPTRFHNSVHNTPAGYWSIATGSRAASSSLCCHDDSFAAGLLEASVQAVMERQAVALLAYDVQYPTPLGDVRPIGAAFAVALVLAPEPTDFALARVDLEMGAGSEASSIASPDLEHLRRTTPAARSLPLLVALAGKAEAAVTLNHLDNMALKLTIKPMQNGGVADSGISGQRSG